jgi:D-beta-D-heptose 7-phosphate kinase/D-beta-D-heptose 1-phosphate adenosyltransferase
MGKIIEIDEAKRVCQKARKEKRRIVFTNGCFDIIHPGHIDCLKKARALGDILIVGLNTDNSVRGIKGESRPIFNPAVMPDIVVKGGDYSPDQVVGKEIAKNVVIVPHVPGYSTTEIIERIKNG